MASDVDVLVVGSGPLGTSVARRLAEGGKTVRILEQGPAITDPPGAHVRHAPRFRDDPDAYLEIATKHLAYFDDTAPRDAMPGAAVTAVCGGQGVIWTNLCPRGDAPWDAVSSAQWETYYGIAEDYLGVQSAYFDASLRQRRIAETLKAPLTAKGRAIETLPVAAPVTPDGYLHFTAPHDILAGRGEAAAHVEVAAFTAKTLVREGARIVGVSDGDRTLTAETVVVAGGAIGTPQLLHRSGIRPRALGRWLSYHPLLICQLVLDESLCAGPGVRDHEPRLQIRPTADVDWYTLILRDVSPFAPEAPDTAVDPNRLAEMQLICPVDLREANGIRFDADSNPTFSLPLSDADQARLAGATADADALTSRLGRYRAGCRPIWMPFGFAHMTGTTRMSRTDDGTGVADYRGRVWGVDNLYLATNGLIPTRMAVNPTLTGVALAAHVADGILSG